MVIEGGGNRVGMGEVVGVKWEVVGDVEGLVRSNPAHFTPTSFSSDYPGDCSASSFSEMSVNMLRTSSLRTEDEVWESFVSVTGTGHLQVHRQ